MSATHRRPLVDMVRMVIENWIGTLWLNCGDAGGVWMLRQRADRISGPRRPQQSRQAVAGVQVQRANALPDGGLATVDQMLRESIATVAPAKACRHNDEPLTKGRISEPASRLSECDRYEL